MFKNYFTTRKMVMLAVLSALATPLMFIEIAPVPIAPWLNFDFSDVVVIITAVIYGPIGAIIVALIKSMIHFIVKGSVVGVPLPQFIAFLASLAYVIPFYYMMVLFKNINKMKASTIKSLTISLGVILTMISLVSIEYLLVPTIGNWFNLTTPDNRLTWVLMYLGVIDLVITIMIMYYLKKKVNNDKYFLIRMVPVTIGTISLTIILTFLNYIWLTPLFYTLLGAPLPDNMVKFIAESTVPFNLMKGIVLSIAFVLLSYRLDEVVKKIKGNEGEPIVLSIPSDSI